MFQKLKPINFEPDRRDVLHYIFSLIALMCSLPIGLFGITIPAIVASFYFALEEYGSYEPPRQFALFLSPIPFAAFIVAYGFMFEVPGPPYFTTTNSEFQQQVPLIVLIIASVWLVILPVILVHKNWRGVLLALLWIPTLAITTLFATMSVKGAWL